MKIDWAPRKWRGFLVYRWEIKGNELIVGRARSQWAWLVLPKGEEYIYRHGLASNRIEAMYAAEAAGGIHRGGEFSMPSRPDEFTPSFPPSPFTADI